MSAWVASLLLALALLAPPATALGGRDERSHSCATCHGEQARAATHAVHAASGVDCIACHGGVGGELDVAKAHGPALATLRDPREAVESCGGCHSDVERMRAFGVRTDQLSLYWTSRHGAKLASDGDPNVATCVSCHGSHAIVRVSDPTSPVHARHQAQTCARCHSDATLMAKYGLPANQVDDFVASVHGRALLDDGHPAAPACSDCHGSHGAQPPRSADVETVCGQCHSVVQAYFDESPHATAAQSSVACVACHGSHSVSRPTPEMFLGDDERHCGDCHTDPADAALAVGRELHDDVERLAATIESAESVIADAALRGLFLGEERGYLEEARGLLVRARTMTHTLSPSALDDVLNRGEAMAQTTLESLATKNRGFRDRRIYTAIFFALTLAFAIALLLYGRELSGRWKAGKPASGAGGARG